MHQFSEIREEDVLQDVLTTFAQHERRYAGVRVRAVAVPRAGAKHLVIWSALAVLHDAKIAREKDLVYSEATFLERWLETAQFSEFLRRAWMDGVIENLPARAPGVSQTRTTRERHPAKNPYVESSAVVWTRGGMDGHSVSSGRMLASFAQPVFHDAGDAIGSWIQIGDWRGSGDPRMGESIVVLPESRATFSALARVEDGPIDVAIKRGVRYSQKLRVKGAHQGPSGRGRIDVPVRNDRARLVVPWDANALELCLLADDDSVLDLHNESQAGVQGVGRALYSEPVATAAARELRRAIDEGENDFVEFKRYVDLDGPKWKDLCETVIAFANARGGRVLVGVTDHGAIEGVEGRLDPLAGRPKIGADPLQWYLRETASRLRQLVSPTPVFDVAAARVEQHQIVVIDVKEGTDKPCEHVDTHEMFVRRGATDRLATRAEMETFFRGKIGQSDGRRSRRGR